MFTWLAPGRLLLDFGPIQATITAFRDGKPLEHELEEACAFAEEQLKELVAYLPFARLTPDAVKETKNFPDILLKMMDAVKKSGDCDLTSMATVAGTFSDKIADFLEGKGATKVMVSNGGDLAIRLGPGESTKVGIVSDINDQSFSHVIAIKEDSSIRGIATSGFGGRSFTKGIASAAVAFGRNCREADAAATLIANHCFSPDPGIIQIRAEELDPETDIKGHLVTLSLGELLPETVDKALENGMKKVQELMMNETIHGAAFFVGGKSCVLPEDIKQEIQAVRK